MAGRYKAPYRLRGFAAAAVSFVRVGRHGIEDAVSPLRLTFTIGSDGGGRGDGRSSDGAPFRHRVVDQ